MNSHAVVVSARIVLSAVVLLLGTLLDCRVAGADGPVRIGIDQIIVQDGSILALVSVTDAQLRPVRGLNAFETAVDGERVAPTSVATAVDEEAGISVLLLVDVSGSMAGEPIVQAQQAAALFIDQLSEHDSAAIVPFGSDAPSEAAFFFDRDALLVALAALKAEGSQGTALYDSVVSAIHASQRAPTPRRALIILTDGHDMGTSTGSREEALNSVADASIPIYTIGLGSADLVFMSELAEAGGGDFYHAPTPGDIERILGDIGATLRSQYSITIPIIGSDRAERRLTVRLQLTDTAIGAQATFQVPVVTQGNNGGGPPTLRIAGTIAVVLLTAGIGYAAYIRRRRPRRYKGHGSEVDLPRKNGRQPPQVGMFDGVLRVMDGPSAGLQAKLSESAIELGWASSCGLVLPDVGGTVASVHARVWLKRGRLMVHHVARKHQTFVGDRPVEWATLEATDTLRIGPHLIGFSIEAQTVDVRTRFPEPAN